MLAIDTALGIVSEEKQWALAGMLQRGIKRVRDLQPALAQRLHELAEAARGEGVDDLPRAVAELGVAELGGQPELSHRARFLMHDAQVKAMQGPTSAPMALATLLSARGATALINASKDPKQLVKAVEARDQARSHIPELLQLHAEPDLADEAWKDAVQELRQFHMREVEAKVEECMVKISMKERHKGLEKNSTNAAAAITKIKK